MSNVAHRAAILKRRRLAVCEFCRTYEQVYGDTQILMLDDATTAIVVWSGLILTLPVERPLVDPMVDIAMVLRFTLLADGHEQHVHLAFVQDDVAGVPVTRVELVAKECWNLLASERLTVSMISILFVLAMEISLQGRGLTQCARRYDRVSSLIAAGAGRGGVPSGRFSYAHQMR